MARTSAWLLGAVASVLLFGSAPCSAADAASGGAGAAPPAASPPATPPPAASPPAASPPAAAPPDASHAGGRELYARYCQLCHAPDATGYAADEAPSLVSATFLESASDAYIARGIRFGRPNTAMAAYGTARGGPLDDRQIDAIVSFLRTKGPQPAALPDFSPSGDAARGKALFVRDCQKCHGSAREPGKAPQLMNPELLAAASPAFLRHAILKGRPPTRMPAFEKRLKASEVADVVTFLMSTRTRAPSATPVRAAPSDTGPVVIHPRGKAPEFTLREERFVPAEQVAKALAAKRKLIIVDARSPADWIQFHIPGAISIPYYDTPQLDRIPNDGTWVVAYCACPHHASGEVVDALRRRGYPNTAVLDEGILFWRRTGYPLQGEAITESEPSGAKR
ncbi:MAG TPA: c-type cytochrome [Polyangiaceae bacterium]|nr:c-type cytochrome [Polyangiaceae bacterium]